MIPHVPAETLAIVWKNTPNQTQAAPPRPDGKRPPHEPTATTRLRHPLHPHPPCEIPSGHTSVRNGHPYGADREVTHLTHRGRSHDLPEPDCTA